MYKKVFVDNLPKGGKGINENNINWRESIGFKCKFIYDDIEGEVKIVDFDGKYLYIKYKDEEPFKIGRLEFKNAKLGKMLNKITCDFKIEIGKNIIDNKKNITIINSFKKDTKDEKGKIRIYKYYDYQCNIYGYKGNVEESNLINKNGDGCPCCRGLVVIEGINDIPTTAPWMVKYFQGGYDEAKMYTRTSHTKIKPICPDCGKIKNKEVCVSQIYNLKSINCVCGDGYSYGHKFTFKLLEQLKIKFKDNYNPDWCKFYNTYKEKEVNGEYDFVIEDNKIIIEVDGGWHRKDNNLSGQKKEESKFLDDEKDRLAYAHGYKVIRIEYNDDLQMKEPILKSEMISYFDLSNIDWSKCDDFALSNLVKELCYYYNENKDLTNKDLSNVFNKHVSTINRYLKIGNKVGWCNYIFLNNNN